MKKFRWLSVAIFFIIVSSLLPSAFTAAANADSIKDNLNLKDLTQAADSIVVGTVTERASYWNQDHTQIFTSVAFSIEDKIKGDTEPDNVTITMPGGTVGDVGEWVSDMVSFDQGERALVFLKKINQAQMSQAGSPSDQFPAQQFEVYQGFRGKLPIKGDKIDGLPVSEVKGRMNKIIAGQSLPAAELNVSSSVVTMPYQYAGYSWPHPPAPNVSYLVNENCGDCTGEAAALQAAAATWSAAGANFSFSYAGATSVVPNESGYLPQDNQNEICWYNMGAVSTLAVTYIWYYPGTGTIFENDMIFNDYYSWSTAPSCPGGYFDVQSVGLHEFGHFLCLSDLYDPGDSYKVMYGYSSPGVTKRVLTADDIAGIQTIYGASLTVTNSTGASNINATSARLNGEVTSTGGENPTVHIYWGDNDGGTGTWDHDENLGIKGTGTFYKDISGLSYGTKYYYRCYATNSSKNDWADSSALFTAGEQKLIGAAAGTTPDVANTVNYFILSRFTATAAGSITELKARCTAPGNIKVAIYADNNGEPGNLLPNAFTNSIPVISGWNTLSITSASITAGTNYWLAFCSDGNFVGAKTGTGYRRYKPATFASFTFPSNAGTGFNGDTIYYDVSAGWGIVLPPTSPTVTNSTGASDITSTSARLNGAITSTGNENPAVTVYYGITDGSTNPANWTNHVDLGTKGLGTFYTDIPGLTPNTTYNYRCYAINSAGFDWADTSAQFTTPVQTQKLIGAEAGTTPDVANTGNYFILSRFTATAAGSITEFKARCTAPGNIKVAIYADNNGEPGNLLPNAFTNSIPVISGWNTISITSASITAGNNYWLAFCSDGNIVGVKTGSGYRRYKPATFSSFTFPSSAGTGFNTDTTYYDVSAGWGTVLPPTSPTVTNSTGASDITSTSARLNGAITSTGNENPAVTVYYGITDGSTNPANWTNHVDLGTKGSGTFYTDIPGLTPNTTYNYRCYAINSAGFDWADTSAQFTTPVQTQKLIGAEAGTTPDVANTGNYFILSRFTATAAGNITEFKARCTAPGNIKVAIYADNNGEPGNLLPNAFTNSIPVISGWNTLSITSASITAGTNYWLAFCSDGNIVGAKTGTGYRRYKPASFAAFTFPSSAGTGFNTDTTYYDISAGWGIVAGGG